jgi:hypothetical protein
MTKQELYEEVLVMAHTATFDEFMYWLLDNSDFIGRSRLEIEINFLLSMVFIRAYSYGQVDTIVVEV